MQISNCKYLKMSQPIKNQFIYLSILLSFTFTLIPTNSVFAEIKKDSILVINSYNQGYLWTHEVMEGFLSSFILDDPTLDISVEYMDTKNFSSQNYFNFLKPMFKFKFKNKNFKLIVVTDNAALQFLKEYRSELFPHTPIIFCGIDHSYESLITGMTNITGVVEEYDLKRTLNLALSLHPETNTLAIVCDSSNIGQLDLLSFKKIKNDYSNKYNIVEIAGWTESELITSLKDLPQNTLVMRLYFKYTSDNVYLSEERAIDIWNKYCNFPTYTSLGYKVETGVLGGVLTMGQFHGKVVAEFAHEILNGVRADSIPIRRESPTRPVFDYEMMQKFGIKESVLPPESIILNKPFSFYEKYQNLVWGGIGIFCLLSLLILGLFINIIKRKTAQKTLIENEKKYRTLVETVPQGILEVDKNLLITFANTALKTNFHYTDTDLIGKSLYEFIPRDQLSTVRETVENIKEGKIGTPQYSGEYITRVGESINIQLDWSYKRNVLGNIDGFIWVVSDITKRMRAEKEAKIKQEQLIQADKMVALGTLVSGVAHEINNPNNFILINIPILKRVWKGVLPVLDAYHKKNREFIVARFPYEIIRDEYFEICSNILDGTNRINAIVKDLKEYSRKDNEEIADNIEINDVITSCINLLGNSIKKHTNYLEVELSKNLPPVRGNYQHFEQIIINLIQNACQALDDKNKSVKIKSTKNNDKIEIHIHDSGVGIPQENLKRIFDPFFTTKRDEGGTGLGLSVSNSLLQKYSGNLRFISNKNTGTTAIVSLPIKA